LTLNGGPNLLTSAVTVTPVSPTTFTISGLGGLTGAEGAYVLTVNAAGIQDLAGAGGFGSQSVSWVMITSSPRISGLEQLATNPRNIVVPSLKVTFSESLAPATFGYQDLNLTRDGGPNLITSDVTVTPVNSTTYQIANISAVQGYAGTYSLTVDATGVSDLAGNAGTGSTNETWQIILETPAAPTNLLVTPDLGISATDGLTSTNTVTFSGTVGASNLTVRVLDATVGLDLGTATTAGTNFSLIGTFTSEGRHHVQFTAVDVAGNVSPASFLDLFLDIIPPTAIIQQVTSPVYAAVSNLSVVFSKPINTNTIHSSSFVLTRNGTNVFTPTLSFVSSNVFLLGGMGAFTAPLGTYQLTLYPGVQDLAGNVDTNDAFMLWVRGTTNVPPILTPLTNLAMPPDGALAFKVHASDPNGDRLAYTLDPGAPSTARINPTNGVFNWSPTRAYASTTNPITVRVTDNGFPPMSAAQSFLVTVLDYLDIAIGFTNVQAGQSVDLPIYLASSEGVTNLSFSITWPNQRFTNTSLLATAPGIGSDSLVEQGSNLFIVLQTVPGQALQTQQQILKLSFLALSNQSSAFVDLPFGNISAIKPGDVIYSNYVTHPGRVAVVQDKPLLVANLGSNQSRSLSLFGRLNTGYQLQFATNPFAAWYPALNYSQTNGIITIPVDSSHPTIFYRVFQP